MRKQHIIYSLFFTLLLVTQGLSGQEDLRREVKLYNPFKPTLSKENKLNFFPVLNDTAFSIPHFQYTVSPRAFMPEYSIRTIGAAKLEPDPLSKLYKSFLNIGFGNYFSPLGELSISSERSRDKVIGLYASHNSSFGKLNLENDEDVFAGYMDNKLSLYGTKLLRRTAISGSVDLKHLRRYAYGYDTEQNPLPPTDKDSLRIDYINPSADLNIYSTRLDSSHLDYNIKLNYDLLLQNSEYYQHNIGTKIELGYKFKPFYASADLGYDLFLSSDGIGNSPEHLIKLKPSISKKTESWAFNVGLKINTYSRDIFDPPSLPEYKTNLFVYPDVRFQFTIIPSFVSFFVALDGELEDNRAHSIIDSNPYLVEHDTVIGIIPSSNLYRLKSTDHKLRVSGGLLGSAGEYTTYKLLGSYTLFEDMLLFGGDTIIGRSMFPQYDDGELLNIYGEFNSQINDRINLSVSANYYYYQMETVEHPWYKPTWDGLISVKYNMRNKILANADVYVVSNRFGSSGPMLTSGETIPGVTELPMHISLNLGFEYRYTKILSFWTRINNISNNQYYEFGFYPSHRFLFMAGFTYSL